MRCCCGCHVEDGDPDSACRLCPVSFGDRRITWRLIPLPLLLSPFFRLSNASTLMSAQWHRGSISSGIKRLSHVPAVRREGIQMAVWDIGTRT